MSNENEVEFLLILKERAFEEAKKPDATALSVFRVIGLGIDERVQTAKEGMRRIINE